MHLAPFKNSILMVSSPPLLNISVHKGSTAPEFCMTGYLDELMRAGADGNLFIS